MMRKCCANTKLIFFCSNSHISLQVSFHSPLVVYVAKGFYETTEISVAKVSRMRSCAQLMLNWRRPRGWGRAQPHNLSLHSLFLSSLLFLFSLLCSFLPSTTGRGRLPARRRGGGGAAAPATTEGGRGGHPRRP